MNTPVRKLLAHRIIFEGAEHRHCIARLKSGGRVEFTPFECEEAGVVYVSGTVHLTVSPSGDSLIYTEAAGTCK